LCADAKEQSSTKVATVLPAGLPQFNDDPEGGGVSAG